MEHTLLDEISKHLASADGQSSYAVPVSGSLGLLALGDVGLAAWREAKRIYLQQAASANIPANQPDKNDK